MRRKWFLRRRRNEAVIDTPVPLPERERQVQPAIEPLGWNAPTAIFAGPMTRGQRYRADGGRLW